MANNIININEFRINKYVESLRPENLKIRAQLDYGFSYVKNTFIIFEIRPIWNDPSKYQNNPFAKIRYYKSKQLWHLYWMRGNGEWGRYQPLAETTDLNKIIAEIKMDNHACFFG